MCIIGLRYFADYTPLQKLKMNCPEMVGITDWEKFIRRHKTQCQITLMMDTCNISCFFIFKISSVIHTLPMWTAEFVAKECKMGQEM